MLIAALFTIAKIQKQLKCPLIDGWIKKLIHIHACAHAYVHTHTHTHTQRNIPQTQKEGNPVICNNVGKHKRHYIN